MLSLPPLMLCVLRGCGLYLKGKRVTIDEKTLGKANGMEGTETTTKTMYTQGKVTYTEKQ